VIRATTSLLPPSVAYTVDESVMFANATLWPGDPDVIRLDRNMCDPRRQEVERLLDLLLSTVEDIARKTPVPDYSGYLDKRFRGRANVPETQTSLF
jgi:hypothetical protein